MKIGTLLFLYKPEGSVVGFIPAKDIEKALASVTDPVLVNILSLPGPYLSRLAETMPHDSEQTLADAVSCGLPSNIRMTEPMTWPPERLSDLLFSAAHETRQIGAFPVSEKVAA